MSPHFPRMASRIGKWPRLAAVAACLLLAAVSALDASRTIASARPGKTVVVVVAVRTLPAGRLLGRSDLSTTRWPERLSPPGAVTEPRLLVGRRLAGPIGVREPITATRLLGSELTTGLGGDIVATSIAIDVDVGRLVHAGDRVDLIAVPRPDSTAPDESSKHNGSAQTVAAGARVLAAFETSTGDRAVGDSGGTQLVLAVHRAVALRIATLETSRLFTVIADDP